MKVLLISSANKYGAPLAMLELCECLKNKNIEILTIKRLITFKYSIYLLK